MNKLGKQYTDITTYLGFLFVFAICVGGIVVGGDAILHLNSSALDNDSVDYIAKLNGIDITPYQYNASNAGNCSETTTFYCINTSGNPQPFALEYLEAKQQGFGLKQKVNGFLNAPGIILYTIFGFDRNDWQWLVSIALWLLVIMLLIAAFYFAFRR